MGDLNCNLLAPSTSTISDQLLLIAQEYNLTQLVSEPTRVTAITESLIDVLFTTNPSTFHASGTMPLSGSDHTMLYGECINQTSAANQS